MSELDIEQPEQLVRWLQASGRVGPSERPAVRCLPGGVSNRTVLVERPGGESWVVKQALPRLRVAAEWWSDPARAHREALGMRWLATLAPPGSIPEFLFEDQDHHLLAMRAVPQPHQNWKTLLLQGDVRGDHLRQFGLLLGSIHRQARLAERRLADIFADRGFFEGLRLEPFYEFTASCVPEAGGFLRDLAEETRGIRVTLVHGDFSPKNILVRRADLVLVDHEVIHWGDPMFDLGFAMAHLLSKSHHVRSHREALAGATLLFWEHYRFATCACFAGAESEARAVRHALGCLLARAAGRSPVEYLDPGARLRQVRAVLALLTVPPTSVAALAERLLTTLVRLES